MVALIGCAIIACDRESSQPESVELTPDESYFVDVYVDIRHARSYYPLQPAVAESLFADLEASVDTVRIARTTAALNADPDRWARIYEEIGLRLREVAEQKDLERTGAGAEAPAQVE